MPTWLVVLLGVGAAFVVLAPIMAVLAITGLRRYVAAAKNAEAMASVGQITKDAVAAYEANGVLCASSPRPVPFAPPPAKKYQSVPADWTDGPGGFECLGFRIDVPQYYSYQYVQQGPPGVGGTFRAVAHGDLNGDGVHSTFEHEGRVTAAGVVTDRELRILLPAE